MSDIKSVVTDCKNAQDKIKVLEAALAMSVALADDDAIVREEVRKNRATLEAARDAIDEQLRKLVVAA